MNNMYDVHVVCLRAIMKPYFQHDVLKLSMFFFYFVLSFRALCTVCYCQYGEKEGGKIRPFPAHFTLQQAAIKSRRINLQIWRIQATFVYDRNKNACGIWIQNQGTVLIIGIRAETFFDDFFFQFLQFSLIFLMFLSSYFLFHIWQQI